MVTWNEIAEQKANKPIVLVEFAFDNETLRCAARDVEIEVNGVTNFYKGNVLSFGSVSRSISDSSGAMQVGSISSVLSNSDKYFSRMNISSIWNRYVTYRIGFRDSAAPIRTMFRGVITGFKYVESEFHINVTESVRKWENASFGSLINTSSWPNTAGLDVKGQRMQILYGELRSSF